jgi:hypothetical protein
MVDDHVCSGTERRPEAVSLSLTIARIESLHSDVGEIKTALKDLTQAITKLALIEERQAQASLALERAFTAMSKLEDRIQVLERAEPAHSRTSEWVDRAIWSAAGLVLMFMANKAGLLK